MKPTTTTTTTAIRVFIIILLAGLLVYLMLDPARIILDGRAMIYNVFEKSLQERMMQFPEEMVNAFLKLFLLPFVFILLIVFIFTVGRKEKSKIENDPVLFESWLYIPDIKNHRKIIELWCKGKSAEEISQEIFLGVSTIHNIISDLRRNHPDAKIPKDTERRKVNFRLSQ